MWSASSTTRSFGSAPCGGTARGDPPNRKRDLRLHGNVPTGSWAALAGAHTGGDPRSIRYSWKIPLSGCAPEYAYERGRFDRSMTFEELKWRGHINALAYAADQAPDFSRRIRVSLP